MTISKISIERVHGKSGFSPLYITASASDGTRALYGPVDPEAAIVADRQLKEHAVGESVYAIETVWNRMFEADRHSRGSHYLMGMSAIDNVLWGCRSTGSSVERGR